MAENEKAQETVESLRNKLKANMNHYLKFSTHLKAVSEKLNTLPVGSPEHTQVYYEYLLAQVPVGFCHDNIVTIQKKIAALCWKDNFASLYAISIPDGGLEPVQ